MNVSKVITLKDGEAVLRIVRYYGVTYIPHGVLTFLLVTAPFFFMIPLMSLGDWGLAAFSTSVFVGLLFGARWLYEWHWNCFVITTRRVVDVDQHGFFRRTVSESPYEKVQDVSFSIEGIVGTVLNFGTIVVQTAGANVNLELSHVRNPKDVHHLITETASALMAESNGGVRSQKVAHLLDTAADLTDAEARAFLVALQEAVRHGGDDHSLEIRRIEAIMSDERPNSIPELEEESETQ